MNRAGIPYGVRGMVKADKLLDIGTPVRVVLGRFQDRIPQRLTQSLEAKATGKVVDYKITDGQGIGFIVQFSDASIHWFFDYELEIIGLEDISLNPSRGTTSLFKINLQLVDQQKPHIFKDSSVDKPAISFEYLLNFLSPFNFIRWLLYSLKDVF